MHLQIFLLIILIILSPTVSFKIQDQLSAPLLQSESYVAPNQSSSNQNFQILQKINKRTLQEQESTQTDNQNYVSNQNCGSNQNQNSYTQDNQNSHSDTNQTNYINSATNTTIKNQTDTNETNQDIGTNETSETSTYATNGTENATQAYLDVKRWSDHGHFNKEGQKNFNGVSFRCAFGCLNCQNVTDLTKCQICMDGFALNSSTLTCLKCADECVTCQSDLINNCYSCYPGWTLKLTNISKIYTCVHCSDQYCGNCSAQTVCVTCKNSFYLPKNSTCKSCVDNCRLCQNLTSCTQCYNGYFVNSATSQCVICSDGCANCTNLTSCTKCYPGFFFNSSTNVCTKCSENCWNCTSVTNCSRCIIGTYLLNYTCATSIDYCAVMNTNNTCSKCFWGYQLNSNSTLCVNSTTNQTLPGQMNQTTCKMAEFRKGPKCQSCNGIILNCQDCNTTVCLRCMRGYLPTINGTVCNACSNTLPGCNYCQNTIFCSQCLTGYYLQQDVNDTFVISYGKCIKCNDNCKTCNQKDVYCTSCPTGYGLSNARVCVPQNQFNFTLLLNLDLVNFASKIDSFKAQMVTLIRDPNVNDSQKQNFVQITKITTGSVKVEGTISATSATAIDSTKSSFEAAVSTGSSFSGMQVLSSGMTPIIYNNNIKSNSIIEQNSSSNTGMIIGIAVGVSVAVLIGVAIAVYILCIRKKKQSSVEKDLNEKKTTSTYEDLAALQTINSGQDIKLPYENIPTNYQI